MPTLIAFHEVDDVEHWLSSPKRAEVFGPLGIAIRTFRDPEGSNRVGLIANIPDMAAGQDLMQSCRVYRRSGRLGHGCLAGTHAVAGWGRRDEVRRCSP